MRKDMWRKGIAIGIIVLFIGANVTTDINGNNWKINAIEDIIDVEER